MWTQTWQWTWTGTWTWTWTWTWMWRWRWMWTWKWTWTSNNAEYGDSEDKMRRGNMCLHELRGSVVDWSMNNDEYRGDGVAARIWIWRWIEKCGWDELGWIVTYHKVANDYGGKEKRHADFWGNPPGDKLSKQLLCKCKMFKDFYIFNFAC